MNYSLTMSFGTSSGQKSAIKISDVKQDLTEEQVAVLMDTIIAKDVFMTSKGSLVSKAGAQLINKETTKFDFK